MGNNLSQQEINTRHELIDKIKELKVPILNIGLQNGSTDYLDFIELEELGNNNIMKGTDLYSRHFIVFKAEFEFPNGSKRKTFTTFFQRYKNDKYFWMCCGNHGLNLMVTPGGTNTEQYKLLYELFSSGEYKINKDLINGQLLNFEPNISKNMSNNFRDDEYPTIIRLGHSS